MCLFILDNSDSKHINNLLHNVRKTPPDALATALYHNVYYAILMDIQSPYKEETIFPSLKGHIWIEGSEGTFLGYGRIALLERIRELGSITKAAKSLEMSYRRAWILIFNEPASA